MSSYSNLWDSTSTLGDSDTSSSRWETDEVPAFPRPCCAMISPRLPKRQRTLEKKDMIDLMLLTEETHQEDGHDNDMLIAEQPQQQQQEEEPSQALSNVVHQDDDDKPKQQMAPPRLPRRQLTNIVANYGDQARLARMRFQCLVKARVNDTAAGKPFRTNSRSHPQRSSGFIDTTMKRAQTI
ncbi:expressed unknown protein [Seminavis robusta]|uniref:Uncharacterized protein n=1 Tax=Seminavis robusta TaxID=568900 RepID=A0A9N8EC30_9STRA|nr:expressed unknown protein [Seminavis robusta]|eukprot:Sro871_g213890.1 n/a (182) ;mRNA; f:42114-42659